MKKPILLLTFNRLSETKQVIESIKKYKPEILYISCDGPRNEKEAETVNTVRALFNSEQWPCQIKTKWNKTNKGCRQSISEAITWFFEQEPDGIILEDDCLPDPTFFTFCEELLEKFKNDQSVFALTGSNFLNRSLSSNESYWFSQMNYSWGWASWANKWALYKNTEHQFTNLVQQQKHLNLTHNKTANKYLKQIIENTCSKKVDSWANIWVFTQLLHNGLCAVPRTNLINNIGFGKNATHTKEAYHGYINQSSPIHLPLIHPGQVAANQSLDDITFKRFFRFLSSFEKLIEKIKRAPSYPFRKLKRLLKND